MGPYIPIILPCLSVLLGDSLLDVRFPNPAQLCVVPNAISAPSELHYACTLLDNGLALVNLRKGQ